MVPTRDRPGHLAACLASLRASLDAADELIVVDSASIAPEVAGVAHAHGATVMREALPGASRARNRGWREAHHVRLPDR